MTQRYTVETIDNAWSYIVGPNGYRSAPIRYRWEAEEWAEEMDKRCCATCNDDPAECAKVPGLRHCEAAMRADGEATIPNSGTNLPKSGT